MDKCSQDITVEFLTVAFHSILYYTRLYPACVFETRRKYGVVVYASIHPDINKYLELCLKNISELLSNGKLDRIEFAIRNSSNESLIKFVFEFGMPQKYDGTDDAYLVKCEQNLRAFILTLASVTDRLKNIPEDASFSIFLHTDESSAVTLANNPELEEFPFIEMNDNCDTTNSIIPLRSFSFRGNDVETFIEQ